MTRNQTLDRTKVRVYPPPPKGFDPFAATERDLLRHGLRRPDAKTQPGLAALWERLAKRYRSFEHLELQVDTRHSAQEAPAAAPALDIDSIQSSGYQLSSSSAAPFTSLFVTWTVPDLQYAASPLGADYFHTFVGLGFLDLHVEMSVDSGQNVTCQLWAEDIGNINLPVRPGDVISGSLCLETNAAGTAAYFLANETTGQTMNFSVDTGFPPAVAINAGVTRSWPINQPFPPLAQFGVVYFDDISAYTTSGERSLTSGDAITMVDQNGSTLATAFALNGSAFKVVYGG